MKGSAGRVPRRYGWPAVVLALAVVAVGTFVGVREVQGRRDSAPPVQAARPRTCETPLSARPGVHGAVSPPDGGGLRVVEKGFATLPGTGASLGAIVENTSDLVAYRTQVDFRVFDKRDRFAIDPTAPPNQRAVVSVILPGQRIGVGREIPLPLESQTPGRWVAEVARFDVKLTTAQWWPLDGRTRTAFRPVTTRYQQIKRATADVAEIFYSVESPLCRAVARGGVSVILRDHGGAIVGGSAVSGGTCVPGRRDERVFGAEIPASADDRRTEIYPYCDLLGSRSSS